MRDPRYKALLIGCGTFDRDPHKLAALRGPANDVRLMREALAHPQTGLFEPSNIKHLLDANKDEMLEAIEMFFNDAGIEDHLFFYYSGHGYPDTNNNLYLCARNTRTTLLGSSAVPDREINSMAENSRARKFFFVLDCCHSGGFKGGTAGVALGHGSGRCLITSCASDQLSADAGTPDGASTFTHHLAEALTSGEVDTDGDGVVLTSEIFKYVQPRVYAATKQTVQWTMDKTFGEAAIACATPRARAPETAAAGAAAAPAAMPPPGRPVLEVSETRIEFREVQPGETLPVERIDVFNSSDGALDWTHECDEPWIGVERRGDSLHVTLDTTTPGARRGNIFVRDRGRGGSRTVRVLLQVVEPQVPKLVVSPVALDFGAAPRGRTPRLEVRVSNAGPGRLTWEIESTPPGVVVSRHEQGFSVEVAPGFLGTLLGSIRLAGNGGCAEVALAGSVAPPLPGAVEERRGSTTTTVGPPADPAMQPLLGWWMNDSGAVHVKVDGATLAFTDHNLLGIKVGQGVVEVRDGAALFQGKNSFFGNYRMQVAVQGVMLAGQVQNAMGQVFPVAFMRKQPWFASFVN